MKWNNIKTTPITQSSHTTVSTNKRLDIGGSKNIDIEKYYNHIYKGEQEVQIRHSILHCRNTFETR